jgi:hypothetical protein
MSVTNSAVPEYWITSNKKVSDYLAANARLGNVFVTGRSAGGRDIIGYEYGKKEELTVSSNFSSAFAAGKPEAFIQPDAREKTVLMIYSTLHGAEFQGCAALINLINIIEHGCDLRGKEWPEISGLLPKYRLVLVPIAQPDGRERVAAETMVGKTLEECRYHCTGVWKDNTRIAYPELKLSNPLPMDKVGFLGGYFNDNAVNIQHDDFFGEMQPETKSLINLVWQEIPDCVLSCHSCPAGGGFSYPDGYVSESCRSLQLQIATIIINILMGAGIVMPNEEGKYFYLQDALHLVSGALPLLFEFPHGAQNAPCNHDEIIDRGLIVFQELMKFGARYKFHPRIKGVFPSGR